MLERTDISGRGTWLTVIKHVQMPLMSEEYDDDTGKWCFVWLRAASFSYQPANPRGVEGK